MCGIAGIISSDPATVNKDVLQSMAACMAHRGPDGEAIWISAVGHAGFAHRRLKVIDLSENAAQPMHFRDRFTIVFNGEIYNYLEIRQQLSAKGIQFVTRSDTEVLLAAYAEYGVDCLQLFDGMFAFAIWDDQSRKLFCARDRFGERPFYYHVDTRRNTFLFASEMKGIYASGISRDIDDGMLLGFLALGQTTDPLEAGRTFDKNIKRLKASHYIIVDGVGSDISVTEQRYWDIKRSTEPVTLDVASKKLSELLHTSVTRRLRSDVRTGMSLSGGLDSSCIAATIRDITEAPMTAFTATFPNFNRDEGEAASQITREFQLQHRPVTMSANELADDIERVLAHQEEPFTSASVYAQFKVFETAAQAGVTVLLDGQGADEVLAGYSKYNKWRRYAMMPDVTARLLELKQRMTIINNLHLNSDFIHTHRNRVGIYKPRVRSLNDLLYFNTFISGLEELLRYADRNAMAHGREVRLPFLFHELVEFAFGLPSGVKIGDGYTKRVLRKAFEGRLPQRVVNSTRKIGFEPPQKEWMAAVRVKELLQNSIQLLNEKGIISDRNNEKTLAPHEAYASNTFAWRVLIAGIWINCNQ